MADKPRVKLGLVLLCTGTLVLGQNSPAVVEDLTVEEILNLPITSVGRKAQQVASAPAAVYVITQEEIRRSGASNLPDILRIVPGLNVTRVSGNVWAISARGQTRQFANKMQVMIDGRPVYNRLFSGVFWDTQDLLLEDIDRIEVIRGAGAVMWGSNAVNGVIHIITKSARDTQGSLAVITSGNEDRLISGFRFGGAAGLKTHYRIWGKQVYRHFFAPDSPLVTRTPLSPYSVLAAYPHGRSEEQQGGSLRGGFRLDSQLNAQDSLQVSAMAYRYGSSLDSYTFSQAGAISRQALNETYPGGNFELRWLRNHSSGAETTVQTWLDSFSRDSQLYDLRLTVADFEIQHRRSIRESNEIYLMSGYRQNWDSFRNQAILRVSPPQRSDKLAHLTFRDEQKFLSGRLLLSAGLRLEHNAYSGWEWQPAAKLLYQPNNSHSLWGGWSRAVRIPTRIEHDLLPLPLDLAEMQGFPVRFDYRGNPGFQAERIDEIAAGYRYQHRQRWSFDANTFINSLDRLASVELGTFYALPVRTPVFAQETFPGNGRSGTAKGLELGAIAQLSPVWKLHGSWSLLDARSFARPGSSDPTLLGPREEPLHQGRFRSLVNLSRRWQFDISAFAASGVSRQQLSSRLRIDTRLGFKPNRQHDLSFILQDLLDQRRLEFRPELFVYGVAPRRMLAIRWTTQF